jgi:hypothetical protein
LPSVQSEAGPFSSTVVVTAIVDAAPAVPADNATPEEITSPNVANGTAAASARILPDIRAPDL